MWIYSNFIDSATEKLHLFRSFYMYVLNVDIVLKSKANKFDLFCKKQRKKNTLMIEQVC